MRKLSICLISILCIFLAPNQALAGGGAAGVAPGTGFTLRFGSGTDVFIPITVRGEYQMGDERKHGIGAEFGGLIGTGNFSVNFVSIAPYYNHYFNGGEESGAYVGAYTNFAFRSNFNMISVGGKGGYQHFFNDWIAIYAEGKIGFNTANVSGPFGGSRSNGGEFGVVAGALFTF